MNPYSPPSDEDEDPRSIQKRLDDIEKSIKDTAAVLFVICVGQALTLVWLAILSSSK